MTPTCPPNETSRKKTEQRGKREEEHADAAHPGLPARWALVVGGGALLILALDRIGANDTGRGLLLLLAGVIVVGLTGIHIFLPSIGSRMGGRGAYISSDVNLANVPTATREGTVQVPGTIEGMDTTLDDD